MLSLRFGSEEAPPFPFDLSTALIRELAVVADDTGCRGRELLRGGDSLGGGAVMYAWRRVLLFGVRRPGGAGFRPELDWVGVLAREMPVFGCFVGVVALELLPLVWGLFVVDGELERVDEALEDSFGLLSFLTDNGSFEAVGGTFCEEAEFREIGLRLIRCDVLSFALPLNELDRSLEERWPFWNPAFASACWGTAAWYQSLGDGGAISGSDKLR